MKKKLLVFQPNIRAYRIDLFNELYETYDATICLFFKGFLIPDEIKTMKFIPEYITKGFNIKGRPFRFGYLKKISVNKPDIILCFEYNPITVITAIFTKIFYKKTKVYTICDDSLDIAKNIGIIRTISRKISHLFLDGIILDNYSVELWYNKKFKSTKTIVFPIVQSEERVFKLINNLEQESSLLKEKYDLKSKQVLLYVGRLVKEKNLSFLIDVFARFNKINSNVVLVIVGDGVESEALKKRVLDLDISRYVIFTGNLNNDRIYSWYQLAEYFILPSTFEPFGAVVNEALISGVPVLCSNLAGSACLINENNGLLFDPYNREELLSVLSRVFPQNGNIINNVKQKKSLMPYSFYDKINELITFISN